MRMYVWGLASELYRLDDLQEFATTIKESDPVDIKRTAEVLAEAQLKLRRSSPKFCVKTESVRLPV